MAQCQRLQDKYLTEDFCMAATYRGFSLNVRRRSSMDPHNTLPLDIVDCDFSFDDALQQTGLETAIYSALRGLVPLQRFCIMTYYGVGQESSLYNATCNELGVQQPESSQTYEAIGDIVGKTKMRAYQVTQEAKSKLRSNLKLQQMYKDLF
jgi:hypothetical protein